MNTKVDTAVLGEDGYYHLNSADGYILYANLSDTLMSLYTVSQTGQLKGAIRNEDGKVTAIIDYNIAFGEYYECADPETLLYPLTDDLIEMFKEVGDNMGWYGEEGWVGGKYDDAWMFACYYTEEPMYTHKIGDVNLDGAINAIDANILSRMVSGRIATPSAGEEKYVVDVNSDGKINALDGNMLKRLISGAIEL